jgi:hypothetical protein
MVGASTDSGAHQCLDVRCTLLVGQKADVTFHRQADHDVQAVPVRGVEQPAWRDGIRADDIDSVRGHPGKVPLHDLGTGELGTIVQRAKCPVGHTTKVQLILVEEDELATHARTRSVQRSFGHNKRIKQSHAPPGSSTSTPRL